MRVAYAREKIGVAADRLATGTGNIKERIFQAYLSFHTLSLEDFPEELQEEWSFIINTLTSVDATYDTKGEVTKGKVENSLLEMDEVTCQDVASNIIELDKKLKKIKKANW